MKNFPKCSLQIIDMIQILIYTNRRRFGFMENKLEVIKDLLITRGELQARLKLLPYDGRPEIKERDGKQYIYVRKRELGKQTSKYVDVYSHLLFQTIQRQWLERKAIQKQLRVVDGKLASLDYSPVEITPDVYKNLEFARVNLKGNIYDQAILEGVATTYSDTETIIENGKVIGMKAQDVQKILNLKHAWEFILDSDVIMAPTDFYILCNIAKLVNEGFYEQGGRLRGVPVSIGHSTYLPPIPIESQVKENIENITKQTKDDIEIAIELCLYCMKTQIFNDGNKRTAIIFANHYLIGKGKGLLVIPEKNVTEFKKLLIAYYENDDKAIVDFMKEKSWRRLD